MDKTFVMNVIMGSPDVLAKAVGERPNSEEENLQWLGNAGILKFSPEPICYNCDQKGHVTKYV